MKSLCSDIFTKHRIDDVYVGARMENWGFFYISKLFDRSTGSRDSIVESKVAIRS